MPLRQAAAGPRTTPLRALSPLVSVGPMRTRILTALVLVPLLAGCEELVETPEAERPEAPAVAAAPAPAARPAVAAAAAPAPIPASTTAALGGPPRPQAVLGAPPPPAVGAAVTPASVEEEVVAPSAPGRLGTTVASLGSPTESGLWLETPLVDAPTSGRIEYNGRSVAVQLRPSGGEPGSGSQISIDAMRAIGATLTSLPQLAVFSG